MANPTTRAELDALLAGTADPDAPPFYPFVHEGALVLFARCHPTAPLGLYYHGGVLTAVCARCSAEVVRVRVGGA